MLAIVREGRQQFINAGKVLREMLREKDFDTLGFDNLEQYAESRLDVGSRTARYWAKVTEVFIEQYRISEARLLKIGWTKLEKLSDIVTAESIEGWLSFAEQNGYRTVLSAIDAGTSDEQHEERGDRGAFTVGVSAGSRKVINHAIEKVQKQTGIKDPGYALEMVAADVLSGEGVRTTAFICACCGGIGEVVVDSLDSGTTLIHEECGGKTVVLLFTPGEYVQAIQSRKKDEEKTIGRVSGTGREM